MTCMYPKWRCMLQVCEWTCISIMCRLFSRYFIQGCILKYCCIGNTICSIMLVKYWIWYCNNFWVLPKLSQYYLCQLYTEFGIAIYLSFLDCRGLSASSNLGARHFYSKHFVWKINKMQNFTWYPPKNIFRIFRLGINLPCPHLLRLSLIAISNSNTFVILHCSTFSAWPIGGLHSLNAFITPRALRF